MRFLCSRRHVDGFLQVDPPEIYNFRTFALALCSCFGGTLFGMDIGIIGGVISLDTFKE